MEPTSIKQKIIIEIIGKRIRRRSFRKWRSVLVNFRLNWARLIEQPQANILSAKN